MSTEYAMQWMVKRYGYELGTWPLGMIRKCAEMMSAYGDDQVDLKLNQIAKEQEERSNQDQFKQMMQKS